MIPGKLQLPGLVFVSAVALAAYQAGANARTRATTAGLRTLIAETRAKVAENHSKSATPGVGPNRSTGGAAQKSGVTAWPNSTLATPPSAGTPYVSLSKTNLNRIGLKALDDTYHLTEEAAILLGMNPAERASINQSFDRLIARHEQLDSNSASRIEEHLTIDEGRKTTFKVAAHPEQGQELLNNFLEASRRTIGAERSELLAQYVYPDFISAESFDPLGRLEKTITFLDRETPDGQRGDCRIFMRVVDSVTGMTLTTSFANQDDTIPKNWRHLIQNLQK
ncbi:MAG TPA: hypothetical protein VHH73_16010 [Verrucomicrobiae bacterium]|nr:hypothetical protein [Verrucomicrobiae bacterium]